MAAINCPQHFYISMSETGVGSMSASQAAAPRSILASDTLFCGKMISFFQLMQEVNTGKLPLGGLPRNSVVK